MSFKEWLHKNDALSGTILWNDNKTLEEFVQYCPDGYWMLMIHHKLYGDTDKTKEVLMECCKLGGSEIINPENSTVLNCGLDIYNNTIEEWRKLDMIYTVRFQASAAQRQYLKNCADICRTKLDWPAVSY